MWVSGILLFVACSVAVKATTQTPHGHAVTATKEHHDVTTADTGSTARSTPKRLTATAIPATTAGPSTTATGRSATRVTGRPTTAVNAKPATAAVAKPTTPIPDSRANKTATRVTSKPTTTVNAKPATTAVAKPTTPIPDSRANKTVCYDYVGCFDNFPPFDNAGLDLPKSPEEVGTRFMLFTPQNPRATDFDELNYTDPSSVSTSHFNPRLPTKFIIHGLSSSAYVSWVTKMKNEFLKNADMNVITVDWSKGAGDILHYDQASANTRLVAAQINLILKMLSEAGANYDDFHLIGHSLGAHTSGYAGLLLGGKIGRITGLDPAEPTFENLPAIIRLDASDAVFVDVIHTNGAPILLGGAGLMQQSGDVDFFVNGGEKQPGCKTGIGGILSGGITCSHQRSHDIFVESINSPCPFTAYPCSSYDDFKVGNCLQCGSKGCSQMGYYSDQYYARGKMYLKTGSKAPYCGYQYGVQVKGSNTTKDTTGKLSIRMFGKWGNTEFIPITESTTQKLKSGGLYSNVIVSPAEIGALNSIIVLYNKKSGFWFTLAENEYKVDKIRVTSGENGESYVFCFGGTSLQNAKEFRVNIASGISC